MNNTTSGFIKKLFQAEGYGFIESDSDKASVFFHKSNSVSFSTLKTGDLVEFTLVDSIKGKAAKNVSVIKLSMVRKLSKGFIFTKNSNPDYGDVIYRKTIKTNWFCSPVKGKDTLRDMAMEAGCNAVLNMTCKRGVMAKGYNYFGTVHEFTAEIAIVVSDVASNSNESERLQRLADREIDHRLYLASVAESKRNKVNDARPKSTSSNGLALFILSFFIINAFLIFN